MDNPEALSTLSTQDIGEINGRENRMANVSGLSILDGPLGFL
jgi:hypothetical protein